MSEGGINSSYIYSLGGDKTIPFLSAVSSRINQNTSKITKKRSQTMRILVWHSLQYLVFLVIQCYKLCRLVSLFLPPCVLYMIAPGSVTYVEGDTITIPEHLLSSSVCELVFSFAYHCFCYFCYCLLKI